MTYFHMGNPHYHRRGVVSLSCSGWEGVGPTRYGRQTSCSARGGVLLFALFIVRCARFAAFQSKAQLRLFSLSLRHLHEHRTVAERESSASAGDGNRALVKCG